MKINTFSSDIICMSLGQRISLLAVPPSPIPFYFDLLNVCGNSGLHSPSLHVVIRVRLNLVVVLNFPLFRSTCVLAPIDGALDKHEQLLTAVISCVDLVLLCRVDICLGPVGDHPASRVLTLTLAVLTHCGNLLSRHILLLDLLMDLRQIVQLFFDFFVINNYFSSSSIIVLSRAARWRSLKIIGSLQDLNRLLTLSWSLFVNV